MCTSLRRASCLWCDASCALVWVKSRVAPKGHAAGARNQWPEVVVPSSEPEWSPDEPENPAPEDPDRGAPEPEDAEPELEDPEPELEEPEPELEEPELKLEPDVEPELDVEPEPEPPPLEPCPSTAEARLP